MANPIDSIETLRKKWIPLKNDSTESLRKKMKTYVFLPAFLVCFVGHLSEIIESIKKEKFLIVFVFVI